jgi:LPXTG-site transpeptidase (sortase) family protein
VESEEPRRPPASLVIFWTSVGVVGAALVVLVLSQWTIEQDATVESVGSRPAVSASATPTPTPSPSASAVVPSPSASPSGSTVTDPVLIAAPVRLQIPTLDIDTKVLPVGLDKNDALGIPEDITKVGWYKLGVPPGVDRGSAVLVAHRDGAAQGRGVFYYLGNLNVGDKVIVQNSAGEDLKYQVVARELIKKKRLPYEELFAVDGEPRLTLISCGGYYDRNNGGYQDNIVVTAVPMFDPVEADPVPSSASASPVASALPA